MNNLTVQVYDTVNHADVSVVELVIADQYESLIATGIAKRDPLDKPNKKLGLELALARALEQAGQKLMVRAKGRVKHFDDIKAQKALQAQKPVAKKAAKPVKKAAKPAVSA